jgi:hypothetical protein
MNKELQDQIDSVLEKIRAEHESIQTHVKRDIHSTITGRSAEASANALFLLTEKAAELGATSFDTSIALFKEIGLFSPPAIDDWHRYLVIDGDGDSFLTVLEMGNAPDDPAVGAFLKDLGFRTSSEEEIRAEKNRRRNTVEKISIYRLPSTTDPSFSKELQQTIKNNLGNGYDGSLCMQTRMSFHSLPRQSDKGAQILSSGDEAFWSEPARHIRDLHFWPDYFGELQTAIMKFPSVNATFQDDVKFHLERHYASPKRPEEPGVFLGGLIAKADRLAPYGTAVEAIEYVERRSREFEMSNLVQSLMEVHQMAIEGGHFDKASEFDFNDLDNAVSVRETIDCGAKILNLRDQACNFMVGIWSDKNGNPETINLFECRSKIGEDTALRLIVSGPEAGDPVAQFKVFGSEGGNDPLCSIQNGGQFDQDGCIAWWRFVGDVDGAHCALNEEAALRKKASGIV